MLTTVAVLAQPPLLVPQLAAGAAAETESLRCACLAAVTRAAAAATRFVAVGADEGGRRTVGQDAVGTFAGYGGDVVVRLDTRVRAARPDVEPDPWLALPLLIAGWTAATAGLAVTIRGELLAPDTPPAQCAALGRALAAEFAADPDPVGLLVVGDGAATHTEKAPGHLDERAGPFDAAVAAALASADSAGLAALDAELGARLLAVGRAPWQVLAAAAGEGWAGELLHSAAPYGVAYHVAVWSRVR
jgi:hypothetical protein